MAASAASTPRRWSTSPRGRSRSFARARVPSTTWSLRSRRLRFCARASPVIDEYDYVVVGGGSSGCVAAATLAESGARVLVLEQGDRAEENPETLRSDGYKDAFVNDRLMIERFSVPQPGCGKRKIFLGSGRGAGGSGGINAMVYTRGSREDFDAWGQGWRWDDVRADFEAVERVLDVRRREP